MKLIYFNIKAQSLSELAIFGGVLLLVLSYFVNLGIKLTYQQDVQMRAFRMALSASSNEVNRPDAESSVHIIEDKLTPDPRNMVGKGDLITVAGQGNVVWGNQMNGPIIDPFGGVPHLRYKINDAEREYSLAMITEINNGMYPQIWVKIVDQEARKQIQWGNPGNELRCYKPSDTSPKLARILINPAETEAANMKTEIITEVSETKDGQLWAIIDLTEDLDNGDPVNVLHVMMPEQGNLDTKFMNLDYVKEQADQFAPFGEPDPGSEYKLQGFLPYTKVEKNSKESLLLDETEPGPSGYKSITQFDVGTTITHYIRLNMVPLALSFPYSPPLKTVKGWIWESAK